jgi:hypothetical protein
MNSPPKKAHLPPACLRVSFRSDPIQPSYAQQIADGISEVRLDLLVRCIGPSRNPQAGGYDGCARPSRSNIVLKSPLTGLLHALHQGPL